MSEKQASSVWETVAGPILRQGDAIIKCPVPVVPETLQLDSPIEATIDYSNVIVITQSCDLENSKAEFVAVCPIFTIDEFAKTNPNIRDKGRLEEIRRGRHHGLHMLPPFKDNSTNQDVILVDFREIYSIPEPVLAAFAKASGERCRLNPPFLEHFSQAFARFFMRVGLPTAIPPFK